MKTLTLAQLALFAVAAVSAFAVASAFASEPTVLFLPLETVPVELAGSSSTTATELQSVAGSLKGEGYVFTLKETATTRTYSADFTNVKKGTQECHTFGDAAGTVLLVTEPYQLVFDSLSPSLGVAGLFTVTPVLEILCGAVTVRVKGNVLGLLTPINTEGTVLKAIMHCSATAGKPNEKKYWPNSGIETQALLLVDFGNGFKEGCEDIAGEVPLTSSKMIEIMG